MRKLFFFFGLILICCGAFAQNKNIVKSNILSLLAFTPQVSYERSIGKSQSLVVSAYSGKLTFITENRWRGASILYRYYLDENNSLSGFYPEVGATIHADYNYNDRKYDPMPGLRGLVGYQFGKRKWIFDLGIGMSFLREQFNTFDDMGNIIGSGSQIQPGFRLNGSIGYSF
jgi:hypothetical protein